eukprot:m.136574 g.136574  ORF g.136574 m.136574 type:complete len:630 (+) comp11439_c0_seq6:204-2093(+)
MPKSRTFTRTAPVTVMALMGVLVLGCTAAGPKPTTMQEQFIENELAMFVHFSMCTFAPNGGCEQDTQCKSNPPSLFNPTGLNTTQWLETAVAMGAKQVCLTAHHTGGFALWQTNQTDYGVRQSPWKGGKGDIVQEFVDSCHQFDISPCLYFINDWDCWESGDAPDVYLNKQLGMLTELLTQYGPIDRLWFDFYGRGCAPGQCPGDLFPNAWPTVVSHVRTLSPHTMMLPGPDGCEGPTETGDGFYPVINYINDTHPDTLGHVEACSPTTGDPTGNLFVPHEIDITIQNPGDAWFYHPGHAYLSASELWQHWLTTIGRGTTLIVNMPPNTTGLIADGFVEAATGMNDAVTQSFETSVASTVNLSAPCNELSVTIEVPSHPGSTDTFNAVMVRESMVDGQSVLSYTLEVRVSDTNHTTTTTSSSSAWTTVTTAHGGTVGNRLIDLLPDGTNAVAARFNCTSAIGGNSSVVTLRQVSLHTVHAPPVPRRTVPLTSLWSAANNDTAPCAFRDCSIYTHAKYVPVRPEATVLNQGYASDAGVKRLYLVYSLAVTDNGLTDGIHNSSYAPPGYADESQYDTMWVYSAPAPGRVALDVYYHAVAKDFWVLASNASRADAEQRGYTLVGTLGYGLAL